VNRTWDILAARHRAVIRAAASTRLLLAFDYDGTLAPIAPTPGGARMPARTTRLLARLARVYPCAVISGRALSDISARLDGVGLQYVFGNHGLESSLAPSRPVPRVRTWVSRLTRLLQGQAGIVIEDKGHSVSVHFRSAPDQRAALEIVSRAVGSIAEARVIQGLASVNLLPRTGANKGTAIRQAVKVSGCRMALYAGDDDTDEDVFGALTPARLVAIHVGRSTATRARFHVDGQRSIDRLLQALLDARGAGGRAVRS
jgi:trehalose 6-phosphate phosphatase